MAWSVVGRHSPSTAVSPHQHFSTHMRVTLSRTNGVSHRQLVSPSGMKLSNEHEVQTGPLSPSTHSSHSGGQRVQSPAPVL